MIIKNTAATATGPRERFTGSVYVDMIAEPLGPSRVSAALVHFTPGARTAWHAHPIGQTLYVTEGVGFVQRRGGPVEEVHAGDRVWSEPGEEHWHGASQDRFMTHLALQQVDAHGSAATWGAQVTAEDYGAGGRTREA